MRLSDSTLRQLAAAAFAACVLFLAMGVLVAVVGVIDGKATSDNPFGDIAFIVIIFTFPVVGLLIARRQPRNAVGWVMLAIGLIAFSPAGPYADFGLVVRPGSLPAADVAAALTGANWAPVLGLVGTYLILLFPDGHLPSRRWRWVGWFAGLAIAYVYVMITLVPGSLEEGGYPGYDNPLGVPFVGDFVDVLLPTIVVLPISFILCAAALIQRFRRSTGLERLQLKWLATAGATVAACYLVSMLGSLATGFSDPIPLWLSVLEQASVILFVLIPLAIGVAMLKHGLYEIDVVINKAVVLGVLAFFITSVYVAIVVGLGRLVGGGERPDLALSIVATAVVAVAFEPVRHRVQRFANRLVYGVRATPYEVLSEFAERVGGSYDAADLIPMMARTVAEGVGATRAEVWLATGSGLRREAWWAEGESGDADEREAGLADIDDPADVRGDRVVEVRHQGELLGVLSVVKPAGEPLTPAEEKLLDDVAGQAGLVLRNVRLIEDLRSSRQRLVSTADEERRRLERNLHDGAQQSLVSVALMITTARAGLPAGEESLLGPALEQAADQLQQAIAELRELARGIHPAILTERGLGPAIISLAERCPVPVVVESDVLQRPSAAVEASLYFVVAEALTNIAKYAHATQAVVTVRSSDASLTVDISDDGIGGADETKGSGLRGLTDRVAVVDGTLTVNSPPGGGTRLTCRVPLRDLSDATGTPAPAMAVAR